MMNIFENFLNQDSYTKVAIIWVTVFWSFLLFAAPEFTIAFLFFGGVAFVLATFIMKVFNKFTTQKV